MIQQIIGRLWTDSFFCFASLSPVYFYLYVNFVDLIFNNFKIDYSDANTNFTELKKLEYLLIAVINSLNGFTFVLGVLIYFVFLNLAYLNYYKEK